MQIHDEKINTWGHSVSLTVFHLEVKMVLFAGQPAPCLQRRSFPIHRTQSTLKRSPSLDLLSPGSLEEKLLQTPALKGHHVLHCWENFLIGPAHTCQRLRMNPLMQSIGLHAKMITHIDLAGKVLSISQKQLYILLGCEPSLRTQKHDCTKNPVSQASK